MPATPRTRKLLAVIFFIALGLRLGIGLYFFAKIAPDPRSETTQISRSLAEGRGFSDPIPGVRTGPSAWAPPTYALLHAAMFRIFGVDSPASLAAMLALNSAFSAGVCVTIFFIAAQLFGEAVAWPAAWAWALFPHAVLHSFPYSTEAALTALLASSTFLAALRLQDDSRRARWLLFGALCGALALTSTAALTVAVLPIAWLVWKARAPRAQHVWNFAACGLALLAVLALWMVPAYAMFHQLVPLRSNFGLELSVGNSDNLPENRDRAKHPVDNPAEARRMAQVGEIAYMSEKRQQAFHYISTHRARFAVLTLRRITHFWTGAWDLRLRTLLARPYDTANAVFGTLVTLLAFAGLYAMARAKIPEWPLLAAILLAYPLIFYITHASMRYRHPIEPFLVMLACVALMGPRVARPAA